MVRQFMQLAEAANLSQNELAALSGVSQSRLSRLFRGKVVLTVDTAVALCDAFGIRLDEAYRMVDPPMRT